MTNIDVLRKGSQDFNLDIEEEDFARFIKYKELLKEWNEKINITAIRDDEEIDIKHFLDSLSLFTSKYFNGSKKVIDIGTGGGFPGLPLKIINKNLDVVLLDSLNKRIKFLDEVIKSLELTNIRALHGRAEELSRQDDYREQYDIAVSRAVASLNTLCEYCLPFVKLGGYFIAMKGPDIEEELKEAKRAIKILGGKILEERFIEIPGSNIVHSLIVIEKIKQTATKYPRGGGKPRKQPL